MNFAARPSHKELTSKLRSARAALEKKQCTFAEPEKAIGELTELEVTASEVFDLILSVIDEIKPENYSGSRPPQKSYEKEIFGKELFAFSWFCKMKAKEMYLKFVISDNIFYYVSFHDDRPHKKKGGLP